MQSQHIETVMKYKKILMINVDAVFSGKRSREKKVQTGLLQHSQGTKVSTQVPHNHVFIPLVELTIV